MRDNFFEQRKFMVNYILNLLISGNSNLDYEVNIFFFF